MSKFKKSLHPFYSCLSVMEIMNLYSQSYFHHKIEGFKNLIRNASITYIALRTIKMFYGNPIIYSIVYVRKSYVAQKDLGRSDVFRNLDNANNQRIFMNHKGPSEEWFRFEVRHNKPIHDGFFGAGFYYKEQKVSNILSETTIHDRNVICVYYGTVLSNKKCISSALHETCYKFVLLNRVEDKPLIKKYIAFIELHIKKLPSLEEITHAIQANKLPPLFDNMYEHTLEEQQTGDNSLSEMLSEVAQLIVSKITNPMAKKLKIEEVFDSSNYFFFEFAIAEHSNMIEKYCFQLAIVDKKMKYRFGCRNTRSRQLTIFFDTRSFISNIITSTDYHKMLTDEELEFMVLSELHISIAPENTLSDVYNMNIEVLKKLASSTAC